MAVSAFFVRGVCVRMLFVAILAVIVIGGHQFWGVAFSLLGVVAGTAFLNGVAFFPNILAVLIYMVAVGARGPIVCGMLFVRQLHRPLHVSFIPFILDDDLIGHVCCR
jgi:hypothetical protein